MDRNFDEIIDRRHTNSVKYDLIDVLKKPADTLPLWVADMDFKAPSAVSRRLEEIARFGIYGYSDNRTSYFDAVTDWYHTHFHWDAKPEWIVRTPGIIFAIAAAIRALTKEGDAILIQQPVYYPFGEIITQNNRIKINSPLTLHDGCYSMNLFDFEQKIQKHHVKLFLLCSPHNPVGRVWTKEELTEVGRICLKHGVIIISDEIHSDFTYEGHPHTVFSSISKEFAMQSIVCTSPSKTFNLAGLQVSNIFIANPVIRKKFTDAVHATGYDELNIFALGACETVYRKGAEWLAALRTYLTGNLNYVRNFLAKELPGISLIEPEGTYLLWLDCRSLPLTDEQRIKAMEEKGRLWLDTGTMFGEEGSGFERINIACPRITLEEAMHRLKEALS